MDDIMAKGVATLQESTAYTQLADLFDHLSDEWQKILGQLTGLALVFFPLMLALAILLVNSCHKSELSTKQEILKLAQSYATKHQSVGQKPQSFISAQAIASQQQLLDIIKKSAATLGASPHAFSIGQFETNQVAQGVAKAIARVTFEQIPLDQLLNTIKALAKKSSLHTTSIAIKKDGNAQLSGTFSIAHYSQMTKSKPQDKKAQEGL